MESRLVKNALESFYGIGPQVSQRLMARLSIHKTARLSGLGHRTVNDLTAELQNMTIENNLRRKLQDNIKRLRDMGTYRGRRHAMSLPVRGQNTRTQVCRPPPTLRLLPLTSCRSLPPGSSTELPAEVEPVLFSFLYNYVFSQHWAAQWSSIPKILNFYAMQKV